MHLHPHPPSPGFAWRNAELQRKADQWRETMKSSNRLYDDQLAQARDDRTALDAALRTCRSGDAAVCAALATRAATGVAEIPLPPAPPPPPPGAVDKALVQVASANMRSGPSTDNKVVRRLKQGELLALLDREAWDGWYPVIHVASAEEGWIHGKLLALELAVVPAGERPSPFRGRKVAEDAPPRVTVTNDADRTMTLTLGSERHKIPPRSSRSIEVAPGRHRYVGAAPGVLPALGMQAFEQGHEYSWRFWIETRGDS